MERRWPGRDVFRGDMVFAYLIQFLD